MLGAAGVEKRPEDVFHLVEAVLPAVEPRHVVASGFVRERQLPGERRYSVAFLQLHRLDCLNVWPAVEVPGLHGPDRRLDLQEVPPNENTVPSPVTKDEW